MEDWQSVAAIVVVLATALVFLYRIFWKRNACGGCGGNCVPKRVDKAVPAAGRGNSGTR